MKNRKLSVPIIAESSTASTLGSYGVHAGTAHLAHLRIGFEATTPLDAKVWMPSFAQGFHKREVISKLPKTLADSYKPLRIGPWAVSSSGQTWGMSGILQFEKADDDILAVSRNSHVILGAVKNSRGSEARPGYGVASECVDGTWTSDFEGEPDCRTAVLDNIMDTFDEMTLDDAEMLRSLLKKGRAVSIDEETRLNEMLQAYYESSDMCGTYLVKVLENCRDVGGTQDQLFYAMSAKYPNFSGVNMEILTGVMTYLFFLLEYQAAYPYTLGRTRIEEASFYRDYFIPGSKELVEHLSSMAFSSTSHDMPKMQPLQGTGQKYLSWSDGASGVERNLLILGRDHLRAEIHFQGADAISAVAGTDGSSRHLPLYDLTAYSILPTLFALTNKAVPHLDDVDEFIRPGGKSGISASVFERVILPDVSGK